MEKKGVGEEGVKLVAGHSSDGTLEVDTGGSGRGVSDVGNLLEGGEVLGRVGSRDGRGSEGGGHRGRPVGGLDDGEVHDTVDPLAGNAG